jgi:CheY-like chemotaxis protein
MTTQKWILLAEDNVNDADLAKRALSIGDSCADVVVAPDGVEVLDCLRRQGEYLHRISGDPSVILLDLKMPKVDGFQVLERLKSDPQLKLIPIVVFSSSREEKDILRCYQLGANAYVVKPMDFQQYVAALTDVVRFWTITNEFTTSPQLDAVTSKIKTQFQWA